MKKSSPKKKSRPQQAKRGPKDAKEKILVDQKLRELFYEDGITPWSASISAKCGYEYAIAKFKEFGDYIVEKETEDWIDRNERVRKRALEGIAKNIAKAKEAFKRLQDQLWGAREIHNKIKLKLAQKLEDEPFGEVLINNLNIEKNYGYYVATLEEKIKGQHIFLSELVQQYDAIEILPPPSAVLQAELEKRIAEKQKLTPALPLQEQGQKK